jgi:hypothetical protein
MYASESGKELLSCTEVGAMLGVSNQRVYQLIGSYSLPHVNLKAPGQRNNRYFVPRRALETWLAHINMEAMESLRTGKGSGAGL